MTEVVARNIQFLGGQPSASNNNYQNNQQDSSSSQDSGVMNQEYDISTDANFTADDIPF